MYKKISYHIKRTINRLGLHSSAMIIMLLLMIIGMTIRSPYFLTLGNFEVIMSGFVLEAIMAIGLTFIIISGGIDLSVSAVLPMSAILIAMLLTGGVSITLSIIIVLLFSILVGLFNAGLKIVLNVHPFIATLAMQQTLRGLALVISNGENISGLPKAFTQLGQGYFLGILVPIWIFFILIMIFGYLLGHHKFFQQIYFIGWDPDAARVSGIKVKFFTFFIYGLSSFLAGFAGILAAAQYGAAHNSFALGAELKVITAVAIGGSSMVRGGTGTMFGTFLGIMFMAILNNAFMMSGISTYWQDVVTGVMLLLAILLVETLKSKKLKLS